MTRSIKLRPYQEEALASIPEAGAFVICLATGLGKTICMSQIPRRGRMLILSHRDELVRQPAKYFDCSFGIEQAENTSNGEEVVSASVQSLVRRLDKFKPDDFDVLVTDECFAPNVLVDGMRIEHIKAGDYVTSYNHELKKQEKRKVLQVFKRPAPKTLMVIHDTICTLGHPYYEAFSEKYITAGFLKGDAMLLKQDGSYVMRGVIRPICGSGYVYNLEVEGNNNYYANGILVHNCHHATASSYRKIYDYFKPRLHLGFTATPNRNDGVGLKAIYQDIIFERNLKWGIENGYLSDIHCLRVDIGVDMQRIAQRLGDFAPEALERAINIEGANNAIAEAYRLYAKPPCLIFCASVSHAENLARLIPGAVAVKGGEDRSETVQAFSEGKIPCITNCMVFTEGTDLPNVQTVIMARPTKNISLYQQMTGRGTRLYPGKEYLTLIDCVGVGDKADICTAPSLLGLDLENVPPESRKKLEGNLFDLPELVNSFEDTPQAWIRNVHYVDIWAKKSDYDLHEVNYFRMPDGSMIIQNIKLPPEDSLGRIRWNGRLEPAQKVFDEVYRILQNDYSDQRGLWDLNLTKHWENSEATEKQKAIIHKRLPDFDVDSINKFEASQILTRFFAPEPPTSKQLYILRKYGYDTTGLTKFEASKLIGRLKK